VAQLAAPRIERLSDLGPLLAFLFSGRLALTAQSLESTKLDPLSIRRALSLSVAEFDKLAAWNAVTIERVIARIAAALDKKARDIARPFYVAITGSPTSIPLYDSMELLGRDLVRERLRNAIDLLGAPSKRELQEWETLLQSDEVAV
jgi:glutamyl-tRNA synthetase